MAAVHLTEIGNEQDHGRKKMAVSVAAALTII
jgi:hypothetical protein